MQLKKPRYKPRYKPRCKSRYIRDSLSTATYTLLASTQLQAQQTQQADPQMDPWEIDTAILYYSEADRVSAIEPVFRVRKQIADDEYLSIKLVLDSLTGASANGAIASDTPQTFTSPSGESSYTTPANETPLDNSYSDIRAAVDASWEQPLLGLSKTNWSGYFSREYDYISYGLGFSLTQEFNQKNTSLSASFAYSRDNSKPLGGAPVGLSAMPTTVGTAKQSLPGDQFKTINDLMIGLTQVLNRHTLVQLNFAYGRSSGYMNDPYKILSVVDNNADTIDYLFEKRPEKRNKRILYFKLVHQLNEDVIRGSYRFFKDSWEISSHTMDLRYRYELGAGHYLQPHFRYYQQSAASFYRYFLHQSDNPQYASADYRLGEMNSTTFGLLYGVELGRLNEFNVRIERLKQSGNSQPDAAFGKMRNQNLFEDINTWIVQLSYSFLF